MPDTQKLPITPEHIQSAEQVGGLTFTVEERQQMLQILNGRLANYDAIRSTKLDNSVPMSLLFNVNTTDADPVDVPRSYPMSAQASVTRPDNLEDAAFYTVTQLAELIRTRQVTSVELTEMYLSRLKRYNEVLECVVTFTEDLAMEQARRADEEIQRGY